MTDSNIEILSILRHCFKVGHKSAEAACNIRYVEEDDTISDRTAQKSFTTFEDGLSF